MYFSACLFVSSAVSSFGLPLPHCLRLRFHLWATVCKTVRRMLSDRCPLSCLSCPVCSVGVLWPNGWMDQDETWHARWPRPGHNVLNGDPLPLPKGAQPPIFRPTSVAAKWLHGSRCLMPLGMDGGRPRPRQLCVRWGPSSPFPNKGAEPPPKKEKDSAHVYCGQTAGWIKMVLGMEVGLNPGDFVLDGDQAPSPIFAPFLLRPNG